MPEVQNYYKRPNAIKDLFLPLSMTAIPTTLDDAKNALKSKTQSQKKKMVLGYHDIRGRAQFIRHLMTYLGLDF